MTWILPLLGLYLLLALRGARRPSRAPWAAAGVTVAVLAIVYLNLGRI